MISKLKVAIVGCGRMGARTSAQTRSALPQMWFPLSHADAIKANANLELVGVCDLDRQKAIGVGSELGLPEDACYSHASDLLRERRPGILSIATRTPGRVEVIKQALANGVKAIHCEKPLSQSLVDTETVLDEVSRAGVVFTYGTLRRYMASFMAAKKLVQDGAIGELREIGIAHGYRELLLWTHPHSVDLLIFFGGSDVRSVSALCDFGDARVDSKMVDCDPRVRFACVEFANGVQGLITSSTGMNVTLSGTQGTIRISSNGTKLEQLVKPEGGSYFDEKSTVDLGTPMSGAARVFADIHAALKDGLEPPIKPAEVLLNQRIIWAIVTSALNAGVVTRLEDVYAEMIITGRLGDLVA